MKHLQKFPMINESRSQELSEEKFKEILDSKCKNWNLDNQQIYRGISSNSKPFLYINPKEHERLRRSNEGVNIYTIIMDNSSRWSGYPKRSESLIATNDWAFTSDYAEWEGDDLNYHVVIPYDNTTWGITPKDDLWFAYDVDKLGLIDLSEFNNVVSNAIGKMRGVNRVDINTWSDLENIVNQIDFSNKENINNAIDSVTNQDWYQSQLKEFGPKTIIHELLTLFRKVPNSTSMLSAIEIILPTEGFSLQEYGNQGIRFNRQTQECWTDGECLMIRRDYFEKMFGKK